MKLHLGCGQVYLEGYTNIDYPLSKHTAQLTSVADEFADLTKLNYKPDSISEVRLHHVFEHFPRTQAIALLASWHSWLKKGGKLHIEVPDFESTAHLVLNPRTSAKDRKVATRHIFGSNEAAWAVHYDGWSKDRLTELFDIFGFKVNSVEQTAYLATRNIAIIGSKSKKTPTKQVLLETARDYLSQFNTDRSETEDRILDVWLKDFKKQIEYTCAK